jgi:hypothetical protein
VYGGKALIQISPTECGVFECIHLRCIACSGWHCTIFHSNQYSCITLVVHLQSGPHATSKFYFTRLKEGNLYRNTSFQAIITHYRVSLIRALLHRPTFIHSWAAGTLKKALRSFGTREPLTGQSAIYQKILNPPTPQCHHATDQSTHY